MIKAVFKHRRQEQQRPLVAGIAAGDVQDPKYQQAITAAGKGCHVALDRATGLY